MEWLSNSVVQLVLIFLGIFIFVKFCSWASKKTVSAGFKKAVFWLTGLGLVVCNVLFAKTGGAATFEAVKSSPGSTLALLVALALVFLFAFALMAQGPEAPES